MRLGTNSFYRKATRIITNVAELSSLSRRCDRSYQHIHVMGTTKFGNESVRNSQLAGCYPVALCEALARQLKLAVARLARST